MSAEAMKSKFKPTSGKSTLYLLFSDFNSLSECPGFAKPGCRKTTRGHTHPPFTNGKPQVFFWGDTPNAAPVCGEFKHKAPCSDANHSHVTSTYRLSMCPLTVVLAVPWRPQGGTLCTLWKLSPVPLVSLFFR